MSPGATDLGVPALPVRGRVSSVSWISDETMGGLCVHAHRLFGGGQELHNLIDW